ncbi:hypothetical protein CFK37_02850 [Virgibacillus phasianinus]|uniref:Sporulation histidine kinase inhibitor Sda n=1 Tax=Virgibacillus phasianinus TaxID=2017483 RepID=A0A220TZM1_9BACI|nr:sporulation histidine kinase inhibitor Sda [Virgibacillus phasianinus]ASK61205.1 hypothetical protein CFK37_02850 [Virgibacillus phasianinus]
MQDISDEVLVNSYKKALSMDIKKDFISVLEMELMKRDLLVQVKNVL